jgi:hypothetical protein
MHCKFLLLYWAIDIAYQLPNSADTLGSLQSQFFAFFYLAAVVRSVSSSILTTPWHLLFSICDIQRYVALKRISPHLIFLVILVPSDSITHDLLLALELTALFHSASAIVRES